eukprot:CCRYP_015705-RA/>CCRYP_015705-RA protein AED:0.00 eAED:0.00 QI:70/1/1/1/0/0/2/80/45
MHHNRRTVVKMVRKSILVISFNHTKSFREGSTSRDRGCSRRRSVT